MNPLEDYNTGSVKVAVGLKAAKINDYNQFSAVYHEIMGHDIGELLARMYEPILTNMYVSSLEDIGCGTGDFIRAVARYLPDTRFTGVDCSMQQVERAQSLTKDSRIKFYQAYASHIYPLVRGEVATMNLDVINHLPSKYWVTLFTHIYEGLDNYGTLLFDMNTQKRLIEDWDNPEIIIKPDMTYVQIGSGIVENDGFVTRRLFMQVFTHEHHKRHIAPSEDVSHEPSLEEKLLFWKQKEPLNSYEDSKRYVVEVEQTAPTEDWLINMLYDVGFRGVNKLHMNSNHIFMKNRLFVKATK